MLKPNLVIGLFAAAAAIGALGLFVFTTHLHRHALSGPPNANAAVGQYGQSCTAIATQNRTQEQALVSADRHKEQVLIAQIRRAGRRRGRTPPRLWQRLQTLRRQDRRAEIRQVAADHSSQGSCPQVP
ncbi:MAG TPA: hypothetical protein VGY97_08140 [Solirubrobacteraceae bacterium]|jgi:hypothetical protein|nr:hypothetical protein [Solirubrobacteraceae bacterium]